MLLARVGARLVAGSKTVVKMAPIFRRHVGRVDIKRLDRIDRLQDPLDIYRWI